MNRASTSKDCLVGPTLFQSSKYRKVVKGNGNGDSPSRDETNDIVIDESSPSADYKYFSDEKKVDERKVMAPCNRNADDKLASLRRSILSVVTVEPSREALEASLANVTEFSGSKRFSAEVPEPDERKRKAPKKVMPTVRAPVSDFRMASGKAVNGEVKPVFANQKKNPPAPTKSNSGDWPFFAASSGPFTSTGKGLRDEPSLKHLDDNIVSLIESEIMSINCETGWSDVAGLEAAKKALREIVVLPFKRPDVFKGIRSPPKGVLLFGPPGTGKTMIGKCVASQCKATFFNISASSLTSKWVGEGEKLVRALFAVARLKLPSVIFIDEIDSILCARSESEHESSRRIKTEFLVQLDGVATNSEERLLVLGATNRPNELDEAARRRFAKRLYIPLPDAGARISIVRNLLTDSNHSISDDDLVNIAQKTEGYSGADMRQLCTEAAMGPIRDVDNCSNLDIETISAEEIRPISYNDFVAAALAVRPTVVDEDLNSYQQWNRKFGSIRENS